jgi:hypothetical protein
MEEKQLNIETAHLLGDIKIGQGRRGVRKRAILMNSTKKS